MTPQQELAGKVAIVTGGAGGIGRATARMLVAEGANVVIGDVDADAGRDAVAEIGAEAAAYHQTHDVKRSDEVIDELATRRIRGGRDGTSRRSRDVWIKPAPR